MASDDNSAASDTPRVVRVLGSETEGDLAVISLPLPHADALRELTPAEREVCSLILMGLSDAEIADRRGTSARTVANQTSAAYRKLEINSRAELMVRVLGDEPPT